MIVINLKTVGQLYLVGLHHVKTKHVCTHTHTHIHMYGFFFISIEFKGKKSYFTVHVHHTDVVWSTFLFRMNG